MNHTVSQVFKPALDNVKRTQAVEFRNFVSAKTGLHFSTYHDLQAWSVEDVGKFWGLAAEFFKVDWHLWNNKAYDQVHILDPLRPMTSAVFFEGCQLNYAWNLLKNLDYKSAKAVLTTYDESRGLRHFSAADIWSRVSAMSAYLQRQNLEIGDRVAAFVTNGEEALSMLLACAANGLVFSSCSPDFGAQGVVERFSQIEPKILLACTDYSYGGKSICTIEVLKEVVNKLPTLACVLTYSGTGKKRETVSDFESIGGIQFFQYDVIVNSQTKKGQMPPIKSDFKSLDFRHPLYILFSSGTTGKPKCIIHGVGGTLLQHMKEHQLHCDLRQEDVLLYFTTCGWMMWNWMVSAMAQGTSLVAFDGSVTFPDSAQLWLTAAECKVSVLGTSPKYLGFCQKSAIEPQIQSDLSALRMVLSTGSPLVEEHYDWFYARFPKVHLASISGGTDLVSCFMLGESTLPVYKGQIQVRGLGMAVECWNDSNEPIFDERGELVCTKPFVSMPVGFWGDVEGKAYFKAYFEHYSALNKEVWRHGDFIEIDSSTLGVIVHGRSDATLNPGGIRIGTAEIYQAVEKLPEIVDSLAATYHSKGEAYVWLFVVLQEKVSFDEKFLEKLKAHIRAQLTPRHVPSRVFPVSKIPYTRSGKKLEMAVTSILNGREVLNLQAFHDVSALDDYRQIARRECSLNLNTPS